MGFLNLYFLNKFGRYENTHTYCIYYRLHSFLESYAIAHSIAEKENQLVHPNREMTALGSANISSAFVGSIPVAGALSRTAVNYQSGAQTKLANIISMFMILTTLLFFTSIFYYLPLANSSSCDNCFRLPFNKF